MDRGRAAIVLKADAVVDLLAGLLLLAGSWDGLWDALDLPQGRPALFVQVGGALALGFAYLLWRAADDPALAAPVALAAAVANGLSAVIALVWVIWDRLPIDVDTLGSVLLVAIAVVLATFALLQARIAARPPAG